MSARIRIRVRGSPAFFRLICDAVAAPVIAAALLTSYGEGVRARVRVTVRVRVRVRVRIRVRG